ncbi:MAG TPA: hypothetical protein VMT75_09225 [Candidatus Saccharimonadales bacterium]|nr:hypothetical protein [Candidatus Saccharimonadales bacterium]
MKKAVYLAVTLFTLGLLGSELLAQEKPKPEAKSSPTTLKLQVTITETQGDKKLANLPYTFFVKSDYAGPGPWAKVRMGSRVPVATGSYQMGSGSSNPIGPLVNTQFQYIDVGTNIDARAITTDEGRYDLILNLERSWVEGDLVLPGDKQSSPSAEPSGQFREPIIRQFKTELTLSMHDGQTIQSTQATDPLSGRILTITVSMNVVK